jgi:uncharacterized protein (TIGR00159 family)
MTTFGLRWQSLVDLVVLAAAISLLLRWSREARALRVTLGILGLEAAAIMARQLGLAITVWVLHAAALAAAVVLVVLFQPELRHALNRLEVIVTRPQRRGALAHALEAIATAASSLGRARRGALIVLTRRDAVNELLTGGVPLGGEVSVEILEAIFRKVSPVHDGATIIDGDRITRVGALMPLSHNQKLPRDWGTRHRAGMGLTERSDAVVIVASEERGDLTLMHDGTFRQIDSVQELVAGLNDLITTPVATRPRARRSSELLLQAVALALALAIWGTTFLVTGSVVRTRTVPIEFTSLAAGLRIVDQSAAFAQLRLRGSTWALDALEDERLVVRADLRDAGEGVHRVDVGGPWPALPPGIRVDDIAPHEVLVRLARPPDAGVREHP